MKLIVYGTLKRGYGNNRLLAEAKFEKEVLVPGYKLVGGTGIPFAIPDAESVTRGEMFEVTLAQQQRTDALEGHPRWYVRTPVVTADGEAAEMYVIPSGYERHEPCDIIDGAYEWHR